MFCVQTMTSHGHQRFNDTFCLFQNTLQIQLRQKRLPKKIKISFKCPQACRKNIYTFLYLLRSNMKGSAFDNPESSQYYSKKVIRWIWEIEQCDAVGMGGTSLNCRPPQCVRTPHFCSPTTWQLLKTHGGLEYESDKPSSCAFCIAG